MRDCHPRPRLSPVGGKHPIERAHVVRHTGVEPQLHLLAVRIRQQEHPLVVATCALHRHEPSHLDRRTDQVVTGTAEPDGAGDPVHDQRQHQHTRVSEQVQPERWDVPCPDRHDDGVELAFAGYAILGVRDQDPDPTARSRPRPVASPPGR